MPMIFPANLTRYDPYKTYQFLVYFGTSATPVAAVSKVGAIKRSSDVIEYKEGGNAIILKGLGRTKYDPITLERGVTQDKDFITFANYAQVLDQGSAITSLANLRKEVGIVLLNEEAQPVLRYLIHRCWVSEFQALPELDAGANTVAIEHIKLENEGWEQVLTLAEPVEKLPLLPVSGVALAVREPTGEDELYVVETALEPLPALCGLAGRVTSTITGDPIEWAGLPATDLAAAALIIRRSWIGDVIRADTRCPETGCQERIDVSFGVGDYLEHHRPRRPRGVLEALEAGWFTLSGTAVRFRVPAVADLLVVASDDRSADTLAHRCIEAAEVSRALARRLDRALSALAPSLDDLLGGTCPACGQEVTMRFDPLGYTLAELRTAFSGIYLEIHALASAYGWPEGAILALPRGRRRRYASIIADERLAA